MGNRFSNLLYPYQQHTECTPSPQPTPVETSATSVTSSSPSFSSNAEPTIQWEVSLSPESIWRLQELYLLLLDLELANPQTPHLPHPISLQYTILTPPGNIRRLYVTPFTITNGTPKSKLPSQIPINQYSPKHPAPKPLNITICSLSVMSSLKPPPHFRRDPTHPWATAIPGADMTSLPGDLKTWTQIVETMAPRLRGLIQVLKMENHSSLHSHLNLYPGILPVMKTQDTHLPKLPTPPPPPPHWRKKKKKNQSHLPAIVHPPPPLGVLPPLPTLPEATTMTPGLRPPTPDTDQVLNLAEP